MSLGIFSPPLQCDNKLFFVLFCFFYVGPAGTGWRKSVGEGGGLVVGRRHLLVTGKDTVLHHPAVLGYLFLQALMVRNSAQIIGIA